MLYCAPGTPASEPPFQLRPALLCNTGMRQALHRAQSPHKQSTRRKVHNKRLPHTQHRRMEACMPLLGVGSAPPPTTSDCCPSASASGVRGVPSLPASLSLRVRAGRLQAPRVGRRVRGPDAAAPLVGLLARVQQGVLRGTPLSVAMQAARYTSVSGHASRRPPHAFHSSTSPVWEACLGRNRACTCHVPKKWQALSKHLQKEFRRQKVCCQRGIVQWARASLKRMRASVQQDTSAKNPRMMAVAQAADFVAQSTDAAWPSLAAPEQCNAAHKVCALVPAFSSRERLPQNRAGHRPQDAGHSAVHGLGLDQITSTFLCYVCSTWLSTQAQAQLASQGDSGLMRTCGSRAHRSKPHLLQTTEGRQAIG